MENDRLTPIEQTIITIDRICETNALAYVIIGGIANAVYGSGRTTIDIDLVVQVDIESIVHVYKHFSAEFTPLGHDPLEFFEVNFVLPCRHKTLGTKVDVSATLSEFERRAIRRGKLLPYGETKARFCSPEDLILFKLAAHRDRDIVDVKDILRR